MVGKYLDRGRVLDIGCGSARMLIIMAHELPGLRFTGIDVSEEMVGLGLANISREGLDDSIELRCLSAEGLGAFQDSSFEMVMSHGSFSGWLDPEASLRDIVRILQIGGYLFIRDWCRSAPHDSLEPYLRVANGNPDHISRIETAFASSYTEEELDRLLLLEEMERLEFGRDGLWFTSLMKKR